MTSTYIIIGIVVVILIIIAVLLIKAKSQKKPKNLLEQLENNPEYQKQKGLFDTLSELNKGGTEEDTIPEGYGEFGLEVTNPIPVNTVFGSKAYLGKLRTTDDRKVEYEREGSTEAKNIDNPIDIYNISIDGEKIATLYISPYHKKNSERAPKGFKLGTLQT
ncbi:MAG: hypothetical protein K8R35_00250 [Bacteroidales bacterium]|nr:hypothetical protein [Bacteroidales bacterium]